jgi:hypothetical protein
LFHFFFSVIPFCLVALIHIYHGRSRSRWR